MSEENEEQLGPLGELVVGFIVGIAGISVFHYVLPSYTRLINTDREGPPPEPTALGKAGLVTGAVVGLGVFIAQYMAYSRYPELFYIPAMTNMGSMCYEQLRVYRRNQAKKEASQDNSDLEDHVRKGE